MNFSRDRDSGDSTTFSLTKWISISSSSIVTQSRKIPIKAVSFLNQNDQALAALPGESDHLAEGGAASMLGGFDVDELLQDREASGSRIQSQQIELRGDREALALLVVRCDAGVQDGMALWFVE